jgi:hypothetical protein
MIADFRLPTADFKTCGIDEAIGNISGRIAEMD